MNASTHSIYAVLAHGPRSVAFLMKATTRSDKYVRTCLEKLEALGKVRRNKSVTVQRMGRRPSMWERIA